MVELTPGQVALADYLMALAALAFAVAMGWKLTRRRPLHYVRVSQTFREQDPDALAREMVEMFERVGRAIPPFEVVRFKLDGPIERIPIRLFPTEDPDHSWVMMPGCPYPEGETVREWRARLLREEPLPPLDDYVDLGGEG